MSITLEAPLTELPESTLAWLKLAIAEDLPYGDKTTDAIFDSKSQAKAVIESQQPLVVSGLLPAKAVFQLIDPSIVFTPLVEDAECLGKSTPLIQLQGPAASILKAERLALNLLQHLSGIATLTYQYAATISREKAKITHTRKTLPGLRYLETQAVLHGGGVLHRQSLSDVVMIKDNHIQAAGGIHQAVEKIRARYGQDVEVQLECDTLEQVQEGLALGVKRLLLDNMSVATLEQAVKMNEGKAVLEASGGVNLKTVLPIAKTGVDIISTSQITLSAPAADIHLEFTESF